MMIAFQASWLAEAHYGPAFDQCRQNMTLPAGSQKLSFDLYFNQSMQIAILPAGLQSLKFGMSFDQCMRHVTLPAGLLGPTLGARFNQSLDGVTLPADLQYLWSGLCFLGCYAVCGPGDDDFSVSGCQEYCTAPSTADKCPLCPAWGTLNTIFHLNQKS